jgi:hypothetical protein
MSSKIGITFPSLEAKIMDPEVWSLITAAPLWYSPIKPGGTVPDDLRTFMSGRHFLSTKQVPSALILAKAGSQTVSRNRSHLLRRGFPIEEVDLETGVSTVISEAESGRGPVPSYSESLASLLREATDLMDSNTNQVVENITDEYDHSGSETSDTEEVISDETIGRIHRRHTVAKRIKYEDPWKLHAAHALCNLTGIQGPEIVVWSGDGIRLQDPLPPRIFGPKWEGSKRNKLRFHKIAADDVKLHVIYSHTHWGRHLKKVCASTEVKYNHWARTLRTRINRFLKGGPDPIWTSDEKQVIAPNGYETRDRSKRALRLIELLKTVDGIFAQRYLANPAEVWTWERFDMFILGNLSLLIGDEFLDGELSIETIPIRTSYSKLKWTRKWFKLQSHRDGWLEEAPEPPPEGGFWARQFWRTWQVLKTAQGYERLMIIGILSQTRGCGTPPPLVVLQSKRKFLQTVSLEAPRESPTMRSLRRLATEEVIGALPAVAVTGLATKARVTVTSSACWEKTRREGGTTEEIKTLINSIGPMSQVPIRNLDTGRAELWKFQSEFDSVGELIFWVSLDRVLRTPPEELRKAFLTVVKEPGKARSVTKARACLKIVLDLVSKLCSEPLAKGIRSSQSGMSASNHGWNFFNSFTDELEKHETFSVLTRDESQFEGFVQRTDTYENLYVSSTDYQEATDSMRHDVARDLGTAWMIKCGIPAVLRGIVVETCYKPREVYFKATGCLVDLGDPSPSMGDDIRKITLRQGVLMGDPLTKPVLHLTNVINRHLQNRILDSDFYSRLGNFNEISETLLQYKSTLALRELSGRAI